MSETTRRQTRCHECGAHFLLLKKPFVFAGKYTTVTVESRMPDGHSLANKHEAVADLWDAYQFLMTYNPEVTNE